jgi:hypothetical protein
MTGSRAFGLPFRHHPETGEHDHTKPINATAATLRHSRASTTSETADKTAHTTGRTLHE